MIEFTNCHFAKGKKSSYPGHNLHGCTYIPLEIISQHSPGGPLKGEKWLNDGAESEATL